MKNEMRTPEDSDSIKTSVSRRGQKRIKLVTEKVAKCQRQSNPQSGQINYAKVKAGT